MMLELDSLTHQYGNEVAVEDVSFGLEEGELVALLGPSGCGKTTIVQAVAGHIQPTSGRVILRESDVTNEPPESRRVSIVFQQSTLYPHMTVSENVAYGLSAQGVEPEKRDEIVNKYLELVDLVEQRDAYPSELSGGQQRRVELARALAPQPDVLLLDEPLSALDQTLREQLREEIVRIQQETGVTTLFVTHDQEEAMALADRLIVMDDGIVSAIGNPRTLYESPPTSFVASFLGRSNTLSATVTEQQSITVALGEKEFSVNDPGTDLPIGSSVTCYIQSEYISISNSMESKETVSLEGEVIRISDIGRRYDVTVRVETGDELLVEHTASPPIVGDSITVELPIHRISIF